MPVIVITRLRLRDPAFFDEFFANAVAVVEQAQATEGNLSADVLAEANNTYWTRTAWLWTARWPASRMGRMPIGPVISPPLSSPELP